MVEFDKIQTNDNAGDKVLWYTHLTKFTKTYFESKKINNEQYKVYGMSIIDNRIETLFEAFYGIRGFIGSTDYFIINFEFLNLYDYQMNLYIKFIHDKSGDEHIVYLSNIEKYLWELQATFKINKIIVPDNFIFSYDGTYKFETLYKLVEPQMKYIYVNDKLPVLSLLANNNFFKFCRDKKIQIISPYCSGLEKSIKLSRYTAKTEHQDVDIRRSFIFTDPRQDESQSKYLIMNEIYTIL